MRVEAASNDAMRVEAASNDAMRVEAASNDTASGVRQAVCKK